MKTHEIALTASEKALPRETFARFRALIYRLSGIALGDGKEGLVRSRVSKRMRVLGVADYDEYFERLMADTTGEEIIHLLDVISTNVTSFFREEEHFRLLGEIAGAWSKERRTRLRLWSAACSTGEEPYSMAMTILEASPAALTDLKILATDLSTRALDVARAGSYGDEKTACIPRDLRARYFDRDTKRPSLVRARPELR
ncbi:MAG TPA: CheR family methyltransferase, partial [Planctomycetota bacterium]|nr:CheR family methyltransferase [Planctomycetota bacterium]